MPPVTTGFVGSNDIGARWSIVVRVLRFRFWFDLGFCVCERGRRERTNNEMLFWVLNRRFMETRWCFMVDGDFTAGFGIQCCRCVVRLRKMQTRRFNGAVVVVDGDFG
ncbi:hypothetical protein V8G54_023450 [Vigna mungo]|uniref:Uncharacterized protein n=1 Tax=Vigna mungo TaxID=3915 RepID=A0AAQ3RS84_VIGMU